VNNSQFDFICEKRLKTIDSNLHSRFRESVFSMNLLLANYENVFPFFTNHTYQHSEQVINYCNIIAGDIVNLLNGDEIYILLMGAALHDIGMGVSVRDFRELSQNIPELLSYIKEHPDKSVAEYTREFHQQLSAEFIKKYKHVFDFPSDDYVECVAKIASGHRHKDLLNTEEYCNEYVMQNGSRINLAYITALVKLADELDITSDRNLLFDYSQKNSEWSDEQTMCYKCHGAIKSLSVSENSLILYYETEQADVLEEILHTKAKVEKTFAEYCEVLKKRTDFECRIKTVDFVNSSNKVQ